MAKKKLRFQWFRTVALNPETLEEDLDWWVVKDTATNEWVSEHDNPRSARNLCKLLNKAANLETLATVHVITEFTENDAEIDSGNVIAQLACDMVSEAYGVTP